jgi:hypothetical protein
LGSVGIRELLSKWYRIRDQETVEFAEEGVAPESEVEATEEAVAAHRHPTAETNGTDSSPDV